MTRTIDFRSDTVTKPSEPMRRAMATAEVGDDVFGDDPSVNRLESASAERLGKEAAVFVPSGTMANLLAVMTHTRAGDEVLMGDECHIFNYEVAGSARVAGVQVHALHNRADGTLSVADVEGAIRAPNIHAPRNPLLCLENTHNRCGGAAVPIAAMDELTGLAHRHRLAVHLDGARLFNAQVALGAPAARIARDCDSVSFCFSKGLGCPVGSVLCGSREFVAEARRNRKMLGGGMRQVGILAAAGMYALEHNVDRLAEDHVNARQLAQGLSKTGAFAPIEPQSNIVVADVVRGEVDVWLRRLAEHGVLAVGFGPQRLRMVTHLDVSAADVEEAVSRIERIAGVVAA